MAPDSADVLYVESATAPDLEDVLFGGQPHSIWNGTCGVCGFQLKQITGAGEDPEPAECGRADPDCEAQIDEWELQRENRITESPGRIADRMVEGAE